jgi:3-(methylthio)propionyl---CoA ligase
METLKRLVIGGAAFPRASIEAFNDLGVEVKHGWGMTESSPIVTVSGDKPSSAALDREAALERNAKQGRVLFGADVRAVTDAGETPWDGKTPGHLEFRGHWVANAYYRAPETAVGDQGWFPTGDVGTTDADGFVQLTDRTKDLIKSGGEWINSIELENIAIGHPDVAEAAAIAMPDEKWGERPLLIVVPRAGNTPVPADMRSFFEGKVTKYAIPEKVVIADGLPYGATGKVLKTELRKRYLTT